MSAPRECQKLKSVVHTGGGGCAVGSMVALGGGGAGWLPRGIGEGRVYGPGGGGNAPNHHFKILKSSLKMGLTV